MEQEILFSAGSMTRGRLGLGLGLERLAMVLYGILTSDCSGQQTQALCPSSLSGASPDTRLTYKAHSKFPQCTNDPKLWLPSKGPMVIFSPNDFYDLVRDVGRLWSK